MLLQAATLRPALNMSLFPSNVVIMTYRREGVSSGQVFVASTDGGSMLSLERTRDIPLYDQQGNDILEYVVPFESMIDGVGRRMATLGVSISGLSAVRLPGGTYEERSFAFRVSCPVNGGGVIQLEQGTVFDIVNPTFRPEAGPPDVGPNYADWASTPNVRGSTASIQRSFSRNHSRVNVAEQERVSQAREERIATFAESFRVVTPEENQEGEVDHAAQQTAVSRIRGQNPPPVRLTRAERLLRDEDDGLGP